MMRYSRELSTRAAQLHRLMRLIPLVALMFLVTSVSASGQAKPDSARNERCRDPHALPVCRTFVVFESTTTDWLSGSKIPPCPAGAPSYQCYTRQAQRAYTALDAGLMVNRT